MYLPFSVNFFRAMTLKITNARASNVVATLVLAVVVVVVVPLVTANGNSAMADGNGNGTGSSVLRRSRRSTIPNEIAGRHQLQQKQKQKQRPGQRELQQPAFATAIAGSQFVPQSLTGYNRAAVIDVDQKAMETQLLFGTLDSFRTAQQIYQDGISGMAQSEAPAESQSQSQSQSRDNNGGTRRHRAFLQQQSTTNDDGGGGEEVAIARLTLRVPLAEDIQGGTRVAGAALTGDGITGVVYATAFTGQTVLYVQYDASVQSQSFSGATPLSLTCRVDGSSEPDINGCLMPTAVLLVGDDPSNLSSVAYTYDIIRDNSILQLPQQGGGGGGSVDNNLDGGEEDNDNDNDNNVSEIEEVTSTTTVPTPAPVSTPSTGTGTGTDVDTTTTTTMTLQTLSTTVQSSTTTAVDVVHPHLKKFVSLYGRYDYADAWVTQAFQGGTFVFGQSSPTGDIMSVDFTNYAAVGRTECVKKATAYMTVWMQVILNMENAVVQSCSSASSADTTVAAIESWNMAVGYYVGSLTDSQGQNGVLLYTLADSRCQNFATCGIGGTMTKGTSKVNLEIMELFTQGQDMLLSSESELSSGCTTTPLESSGGGGVAMNTELQTIQENLVRSMTVPLLQGALRYAYIQANDPNRAGLEKIEAEKVAFTGSILPMVYDCSPDDALIIYENTLGQSRDSPNYAALKGAYERNYECLGVTCDDVGGLFDSDTNGYLAGAEPCIDGQIPSAAAAAGSGGDSSSAASTTATWLSMMMTTTSTSAATTATLIMGVSTMILFLL